MSTKSVVFNLDLWGLQPSTPLVCYWYCHNECQKSVINNAHKTVHIRETLFWNRNSPVSQTLRCIFQCATATENKSLMLMHNITITTGTRVMKCNVIQIQPVIIFQSSCFALNRAKYIHGCPLLNKYKEMRQKSKKNFHHCVHDHCMYIVCPDMLSMVGETS